MAAENYLAILKQGVINLDFDAVKKAAQDAMDAEIDPSTAITEGMVPGNEYKLNIQLLFYA